ncbi:unnamed protein product [Rangifer tarandus platyrhynchus]|uniref:Uncharacterized protein n=1 Tax=Rangifer tarandus platyrhynchus TaxID=3082113 RepID=A0AC59Y6C6_RANTA
MKLKDKPVVVPFMEMYVCALIYRVVSELPRWWHSVKNLPTNASRCSRCGFNPWVRKMPWAREWQPTPVFWPGKSYRQRSLGGYSQWGHKQSDTTEHAHTTSLFSRRCI